jgi:hypothetical protein
MCYKPHAVRHVVCSSLGSPSLGTESPLMWIRICHPFSLIALVACLVLANMRASVAAADGDFEMRVESSVYRDKDDQPIGRSLALFTHQVVWDFLELPDADGALQLAEVVLHDPLRERTVLVDPHRKMKVEIDKLKLDRLRVSLASWARGAEDPVIRWAASSSVTEGLHLEHEPHPMVVLTGPKVRYEVDFEEAASPEAALSYQQFADVSLLLKALVHPGGIPPYPRMAINHRLVGEQAIPREVRLNLAGDLPLVGGIPGVPGEKLFRSEHRTHPRLLTEDRRRIADASTWIGEASVVSLEVYANPGVETTAERADEATTDRSLTR